MKTFDEVTRATQRKRLRHLAAMALQRYGIEEASAIERIRDYMQ